jgi:hypothetical protein
MLSHYQGQRMNEQRCDAPSELDTKSQSADDLLELVARIQGDRMDEQRFEIRDPEDIVGATSESKSSDRHGREAT